MLEISGMSWFKRVFKVEYFCNSVSLLEAFQKKKAKSSIMVQMSCHIDYISVHNV
jgi:hypothetical protein